MIERSFDIAGLTKALEHRPVSDFNPEHWLLDERNMAFTNQHGDFALFEADIPGVYTGHYFYNSRGKAAISFSKDVLREVFMGGHGVGVIRGMVPLYHVAARWMTRRLGFSSYGVVKTDPPCELFLLTKQEYLHNG